MSAHGPSRHIALPHELGRHRSKADIGFVAAGFIGTRPSTTNCTDWRGWTGTPNDLALKSTELGVAVGTLEAIGEE